VPVIYAEDLTKMYDDFLAVDGISLNVKAGEVLILLGPNGAGKTTSVRMLTSILTPTRGRAIIAGYDVVRQADKVRACVGVLTEHHGLYGRMNADEYLNFFGQLYGLDKTVIQKRSSYLLEEFGLAFARKKRLGEYSKGMRQKLALVRAMLHDPPVLLLDEPTSAMDPESARLVRDSILSLRSSERTILLCTHNLVEAEELADIVAIIRKGKIVEQDNIENLKRKLLGPPLFEAKLANKLDGKTFDFPDGVQFVAGGEDWLRFQVNRPEIHNPILLKTILDQQLQVISFQEVPRSLEQAYLEAVTMAAKEDSNV
jgi:ABC-2 type transport system ATP-binding protein